MKKKLVLFIANLLLIAHLYAQNLSSKQLEASLDKLLSEQFKADETGGVALVSQNGQIIYKKAFGMANLEKKIPMQTDMVFSIGSITKQFTAIAILQLMEQGKLSLQDEITKFIPDYPTNAHKITIEHLLTHTSGIMSYTNVKEFGGMMHESKKPEEIINFFKNQPMEFVPGTNWNYNNSGYFLLGYIIEKISGKTYPQYIKENFFTPLGMTNSYDGSDKNVISNQPTAYQVNEGKVEIAEVINMTLPCATGSLLSTAEDLFKWHQALHTYKVVKKENLQKAFTEYKLANGVGTGYGYGWFLDNIQGSPTVEHGGDINGFLTNAIYLPKQDVFVAVFSNNSFKSTDIVSAKIAALTIGNPYNYKEITLNNHVLQDYAGIYKNEDGEQRIITLENKQLYSQRNNWEKFKIKSFQKDTFFFDDSLTILAFQRNMVGKIESVLSNERMGKTMMWKKIQ